MEEESIGSVFNAWFQRQRPAIQAAMLVKGCSGQALQLSLACAPANLIVNARPDDLSVWVEWENERWDMLLSEETRAERDGGAWRCGICKDEGKTQLFDTPGALWVDHFFDPLGQWLESTLAPAAALVLHQREPHGSTWAELVSSQPPALGDTVRAVVPLRHGRCQFGGGGARAPGLTPTAGHGPDAT